MQIHSVVTICQMWRANTLSRALAVIAIVKYIVLTDPIDVVLCNYMVDSFLKYCNFLRIFLVSSLAEVGLMTVWFAITLPPEFGVR